jgi:hypothetical protein
MYEREQKRLHDTKSGQAAGTTHQSKWQYFTTMSFVNAVMIPRPTPSHVVTEASSVLGSTRNLENDNASTNISIDDNDSDESIEHQVKKRLGTKRKINFQEKALHLGKKKIKLMEDRLMKKSQADAEEDCMFLMSLLPSIK